MNRINIKILIKTHQSTGGRQMRHALLAFAMLRGMPYRAIEFSVRKHHEPSPSDIAELLACDVDTVKAWLATPATEHMVEVNAIARDLQLAAKAARRVAIQSSLRESAVA